MFFLLQYHKLTDKCSYIFVIQINVADITVTSTTQITLQVYRHLCLYCFFPKDIKMPIKKIQARQIFDSRGNPTVEVRNILIPCINISFNRCFFF